MKFAIRDDDTSYFTQPVELAAAYGELWNDVPVSLAVIPFDVPTYYRGIPEKFYQEPRPVSMEENPRLVEFLRSLVESGRVHIMLHGYNHLYKVTGPGPFDPKRRLPEFTYVTGMREKLKRGRALLERLFGARVSCFVPPSNAISAAGLRGLAAERLNLAGTTSGRMLVAAHPLNVAMVLATRRHAAYPYNVRRFIRHKQVMCHALTPSTDWAMMCSHLERCSRKDGVFVAATHYWEKQVLHPGEHRSVGELLEELVARAKGMGAEFVTVEQVFG